MAKYLDNTGLSYLWGKIKTLFVPQTRKINNKALDADITLTAEDVGALADADMPITLIENNDSANKTSLRSLDSGTYVLKGYFKPFESSTDSYTFSTGMLVAVVKTASMSYVQILYAKGNTVQYLEISDTEVTRKDAKLQNMESTANKAMAIEETSDDYHYPSAKAVYDATKDKLDKSGGTMTGALTLSGDPVSDLDAATKKYVDDESKMLIKTVVYDSETDTYSFENATGNEYAEFLAAWQDGRAMAIKYYGMLYFGDGVLSDSSIGFHALTRLGCSTSTFVSETLSTTYQFNLTTDNSLRFLEYPNCAYAYFIAEQDSDGTYKLYNYNKTAVVAEPYTELAKLYKNRIPIKIFYASIVFDVSYYSSSQLHFHSSDIKLSELPNKVRRLTITSSNEITYSESPVGQVALYYLKKDDDGNWTLLDAKKNVITTPHAELTAQYAALTHIVIYNQTFGKMAYIDYFKTSYLYIRELPTAGSSYVFSNFYKITSDNVITAYAIQMETINNKVSDIATNATNTVKYPNCKAVTDYVAATKALVINVKHNIFDENNPNPYFVDIGSNGDGIYLAESTENKYTKIMDALKNSVPCVLRVWQNSNSYYDYAFTTGGYNGSILFVSSTFTGNSGDSGYTIEYPGFGGYLIGTDNSITATNYIEIETQSNRTDDIESNATASDMYPSAKAVADYVATHLASNTSVTLAASGWADNSQTVAASGVTASNNIVVSPAPDYISAYINGSIRCTAQSDGALTFVCSTVPTVDIVVNLIIN